MLFAILNVVIQFALNASDPHWTCELAHRDAVVPGIEVTGLHGLRATLKKRPAMKKETRA